MAGEPQSPEGAQGAPSVESTNVKKNRASELREQYEKKRDASGIIESVALTAEEKLEKKSSEVIDSAFDVSASYTGDSDLSHPDGEKRKDFVQAAKKRVLSFISQEDTESSPDDKPIIKAQVVDAIKSTIASSDPEDGELTPEAIELRQQIAEEEADRVISSPDYKQAVRDEWRSIVEAPPTTLKESEVVVANLRNVEEFLDEFNETVTEKADDGSEVVRPGKMYAQMAEHNEQLATTAEDFAAKEKELNEKLTEGNLPRTMSAEEYDRRVKAALDSGNTHDAQILQEVAGLSKDLVGSEHNAALQAIENIEGERRVLLETKARLSATLEEQKLERVKVEDAYAERIGNVFSSATQRYYQVENVSGIASSDQEAADRAGTEQDPMSKSLQEAIATHWGEVKMPEGKIDTSGLDRNKIRTGINMLSVDDPRIIALGIVNPYTGKLYTSYDLEGMTDDRIKVNFEGKNPEYLLTSMLLAQNKPGTQEKWTPQDIADKKQADPDFFTHNQNDAIIGLARKSVLVDGIKPLNGLIDKMAKSKWGNDALLSVVNSKDFKDEIDGAIENLETQAKEFKDEFEVKLKKDEHGNDRPQTFKEYSKNIGKNILANKKFIAAFLVGGVLLLSIAVVRDYKMQVLLAEKENEAAAADHGADAGHAAKADKDKEGSGQGEEAAEATHTGGTTATQSAADAGHAAKH